MQWSGPMPHPDDLDAYERILPGAADRILTMAEKQTAHRQRLEEIAVTGNEDRARRGQRYGLIIGLGGLGASVGMVALGEPQAAIVIGGATLVSLVGAFLFGSHGQRRERAQRWRQATGA